MGDIEHRVEGGLEMMASLERVGAATETGLELPAGLSYDRYEALGMALGRAYRAMVWMIADWINYGERCFPETYAQAVEITQLHPETLKNYARIAAKVPPTRRIAGVPMGIHAEVASLPPEEQTEWLERVVQNRWRREDLRRELRPVKNLPPESHARVGEVEEVARDLVRSAKKYGNDFLVQRPSFVALCAALGEDV